MRNIIIKVVREVLEKEENVVFAYFFGSFVSDEKFGDIDIGIYLGQPPDNIFTVSSELKHRISRHLAEKNIALIADKIDILVLNSISFAFLNRIFNEGQLILDRDSEVRTDVIEKNSIKFRECLGLLKEAGMI